MQAPSSLINGLACKEGTYGHRTYLAYVQDFIWVKHTNIGMCNKTGQVIEWEGKLSVVLSGLAAVRGRDLESESRGLLARAAEDMWHQCS